MAQLRKITPSPVLSNFRQPAPTTGYGFRVLAGAMAKAYDRLEPAAIQEQTAKGTAAGRQMSGGAMPAAGSPALSVSGINESLARTESGGDYSVVNSEGFTGKYQWGQARLDDYNRANGTSFSLAEFRGDPALQERAQAWHVKDIVSQTGDLVGRAVNGITMTPAAIVAMAHLGGIGGARRFVETNGAYDPADSNGTRLSDYAKTHGGAEVVTGQAGADTLQPTTIRTADGGLEARLYSPASGPILQAFNAAAQVAYQSDMMVKGAADIMGLSAQFPLDPEGFAQAAQGYVTEAVKNAPELFRPDLEAEIQEEVQRRYLGIMADRQDDIRQRADNSSQALVDLWSGNLASAIATGNADEIAAAQEKLDSILVARESLPGVGWTPEQSELVRQRAVNAGEADREQQRTEAERKAAAAAKEVQQRTDASAQALTEIWSDRVSTALASGDVATAMRAQAELDKVLAQREASPGAIWTPAQSEGERQKAIAKGSAAAATAAAKAATEASQNLDRAISTAKAGGMEPEEALLLADPKVAAQFPEKVATLASLADLRTTLPTFTMAPKAEREAQIAAIGTPDNAGEVAKKKALQEVNREITGAFMKDPIAAASTYLPEAPPPIPTAETAPEDAVPMLQARKAYAERLVAEGYAPKVAYLSAQEAEAVGSLFSKEAPIDARLMAAEMLTQGFGEAAPQVFATLKNVDPTTKAAGMMSAATGSRDVAMEAMMGRAMVDAGQSKAKFPYASARSVDPMISAALIGLPVPESDIMALASGIMAYQNPEGFENTPEGKRAQDKAASEALNRALGQSVAPTGDVTGGVQNVMGFSVLLPVGVSAKAVEDAFGYGAGGFAGLMTQGFVDMAGGGARGVDLSTAAIGSSAGSQPMMGGIPLTQDQIASGNIALAPVLQMGPTAYRMIYSTGAGAAEVRDASGGVFVIDIEKLVTQ
jgi:hypothetical protein